jgi:hypothetical protein
MQSVSLGGKPVFNLGNLSAPGSNPHAWGVAVAAIESIGPSGLEINSLHSDLRDYASGIDFEVRIAFAI